MQDYPRELSKRHRLIYGIAGVLLVMVVWWGLTDLYVIEETRVISEYVEAESGRLEDGRHVERKVTTMQPLVAPRALSSPQATLSAAWELLLEDSGQRPSLGEHILWSTFRVLLGFLISALIAVPLGTALALFPKARALASPIISFLRPLPSISWLPLAVIWFGISEVEKLAILFMGCFTAALLYTIEAALKVDPVLVRAARNLGASDRQILTKVLLPAAMPNIVAGLKVVLAIAWTCIISAEIVGTTKGLGSLIWLSKETSSTALVITGMVCISTIVLVMDWLFSLLERKMMPWAGGAK